MNFNVNYYVFFVRNFIFGGIFFASIFCFSQGQTNWWYFGQNAGLHFNPAPTPVLGSQIYTNEGVASISDPAGNLLFYTDGVTVWNQNHIQMPNGSGLLGTASTSQSALIVQKPGSNTIYYLFTADREGWADGFRYSEIDMSLAAGLGDITAAKNILLYTPTTEKICAVKHCNNTDIWVVTHHWGSNEFRAYLVTAAGVNPTPVVTAIGPIHAGAANATMGYLKSSPDGTKLALAVRYTSAGTQPGFVEMYDFNNATGGISNQLNIGTFSYTYGVEFSPNSQVFYCGSSGNIYQFNLCAGTNAQILASLLQVGNSASTTLGSLQLGPDNKIYIARWGDPWLGVINNPHVVGMGCNYVDNGQSMAGALSNGGLPNFPHFYFRNPPAIQASMNCLSGAFSYTIAIPNNCNTPSNTLTSVLWNFDDPGSGTSNTSSLTNPTHIFSAPGNYTVTLTLNYPCYSDTAALAVTILQGFSITSTNTAVICNGGNTGSATASTTGGINPFSYLWSNGQTSTAISGLIAGTYTVTVTDGSGCVSTQTVAITQPTTAALTASVTSTNTTCETLSGTATAAPNGGIPGYTYLWNNGDTTQIITGLGVGAYLVTVTDFVGCTATRTVTITSDNVTGGLLLPNAFSPNDDGENDFLKIYYVNPDCIKTLRLTIYNRWGEQVFYTTDPSAQWDGAYKDKTENTAVYVYYLDATLITGENISKKGNISLIR